MGAEGSQTKSTSQSKSDFVDKKGFRIPKGDFAHFLGWKGKKPQAAAKGPSGRDTLGRAIQQMKEQVRTEFQKLGKSAVGRGEAYSKVGKAAGDVVFKGAEPQGQMAVVRENMELGQAGNIKYLELQYKFQFGSRSYSVLSNIMRRRNETVRNSLNSSR